MKENYFESINTKDKAYWLGVLYAEGYMETRNQKPYRLGIQIGTDDEIIIDRFIKALDLNPNIKHYRERDHTVFVKFVNKKIVKDLVKWGVVPRKSKIIELPNLSKRELYLAFLLGFYDGDGKTGTTRIITGSKLFLDQIKKHFNLPFKIYEKNSSGYWKGRFIVSHAYSMSLGVELYNEMLANYHTSLQRKRHKFQTEKERIAKIRERAWRSTKNKLKISVEELKELVWKLPLYKIANKHGVSDKTIKKWCIKWGIVTPPLGYWVKKRIAQKNNSNKEKEKNKSKEKAAESEKETKEKKEEKNKNTDVQEDYHEETYEEVSQKTPEGEQKENEESTRENQTSDESNEKKIEYIIKESKQEHPFDRRFSEVEGGEDFSDPYLWISPKVRENIEKSKEKLLEKAREKIVKNIDSLSSGELESESENNGHLTEHLSSSNSLVENQPLINPEIDTEVVPESQQESLLESESSVGNLIIEEPIIEEPEIEEPDINEPITEDPEIEEPDINEPITEDPEIEEPIIEEPILEDPEIEEPIIDEPIIEDPEIDEPDINEPIIEDPEIDEPDINEPIIEDPEIDEPEIDGSEIDDPEIDEPEIEDPEIDEPEIDDSEIDDSEIDEPEIDEPDINEPIIEDPEIDEPDINEPITEDPDMDDPKIDDLGEFETPIEDIIGAIGNIPVLHYSFQSSNSGQQIQAHSINNNDDIDEDFDDCTIRDYDDNFNDDIDESFDDCTIRDYDDIFDDDIDESFDDCAIRDYDDNYDSSDDPIIYINIGDYVPEAEAYSSYGYSDCPDDYSGE